VSRLYAGVQEIENEWLVGPIPVDDGAGKNNLESTPIGFLLLSNFHSHEPLDISFGNWHGI